MSSMDDAVNINQAPATGNSASSRAKPSAGWAHSAGVVSLTVRKPDRGISALDYVEINELFARYAIAYDERRLDILGSCFESQGVYQVADVNTRLAKFEGRDAIVLGIASVQAQQGDEQRRHLMGNVVLNEISPEIVEAIAYASVTMSGIDGISLQASAIYGALVAKNSGGWLFRNISVGLDSYVGDRPVR